eukprot:7781268-Pyramimonas_sp.AAC.1
MLYRPQAVCGPCSEPFQEHRPGCPVGLNESLSPNRGRTPHKEGRPPLIPMTQDEIAEINRRLGITAHMRPKAEEDKPPPAPRGL